ncbi:hypothetical protein UREG_02991 [Uncinocarpus reesii 1704]|uniref:Major facilitator superfamily (MFS) profile domain-containing protein n=1 Tax=Uncinocarpus reesii (strain UAMH 1704) TaxID=336963 RepID=C4JNJ3_UNCRE|nr:uncharacterized protein UREG_02991 [Uncinocarpus reesii 1704]EEP78146.1 hypothetical protein UREG_02991 [Uncinocarpus reesii 1704]
MPSPSANREPEIGEIGGSGIDASLNNPFITRLQARRKARHSDTKESQQSELSQASNVDGRSDKNTSIDEDFGERLPDGRIELQESDCYEKLGFCFSTTKKWTILCVIFAVQISMNFNTSVYANAITPMSEEFSLPEKTVRLGQMIFLVAYAFGCELWAPWSEEFGRWRIMQLSLAFVNVWQVLCGVAPNFWVVLLGRFLGGLSSAGGSVTLGMVADMWEADDQQFAVAFIVLSSVAGSVVGPIAGGFMEVHLHWRWNFWIQLILGSAVQFCHFLLVPETRATVLLDKEAQRLRKSGMTQIYGPGEIHGRGYSFNQLCDIWIRPFSMFVREPIVLCLSLLSGFSDALIFTFLESYQPVFSQWGFGTIQVGLAFIPIIIGYFIGYLSFIPVILRHKKDKKFRPHRVNPERRLWWLQITTPLECVGLFLFAWSSFGPPLFHWMAPMFFSMMIAVANVSFDINHGGSI